MINRFGQKHVSVQRSVTATILCCLHVCMVAYDAWVMQHFQPEQFRTRPASILLVIANLAAKVTMSLNLFAQNVIVKHYLRYRVAKEDFGRPIPK